MHNFEPQARVLRHVLAHPLCRKLPGTLQVHQKVFARGFLEWQGLGRGQQGAVITQAGQDALIRYDNRVRRPRAPKVKLTAPAPATLVLGTRTTTMPPQKVDLIEVVLLSLDDMAKHIEVLRRAVQALRDD